MNNCFCTRLGWLMVALMVALIAPATAIATPSGNNETQTLKKIDVKAPVAQELPMAAPYSVLDNQQLLEQGHATLGDTLSRQPGVHSDSFGGGASRPVIRGQKAPRVSVLSGGSALLDASSVSPDHAITVEPMLASRIDVLRGPATLRYDGGASGGLVNVLDNRIPRHRPLDGVEGFVALRTNTVANENATAGALTTGLTDHLILHLEGARRHAENYKVNGAEHRTVTGTFADSNHGSIGASWVGAKGYIGLAYRYRRDHYGLPGHNHHFDDCQTNGNSLDCPAPGPSHNHDHDDAPYVDLASRRVDLRGEYRHPLNGIAAVRLHANHTDYRHHEIEHDAIATTFKNQGGDVRVEVEHTPLGKWQGLAGAQYTAFDFRSAGNEALIPKTRTQAVALFVVEQYPINDHWSLELSGRQEHQRLTPSQRDNAPLPAIKTDSTSLSSAAKWAFQPGYQLTLSLSRSQRAPTAQQAYARGVHLASNTYECGLLADRFTCGGVSNNAALNDETTRAANLNLRKTQGDWVFDLDFFHKRTDHYVYARTLDRREDFRLIKYSQDDVIFTGGEVQASFFGFDPLAITVFGDRVRATFKDGGYLPRLPAKRLGLRLNHYWGNIDSEVEVYHSYRQNQAAGLATPTPSHDAVNATLSYRLRGNDAYHFYLRGNNLLNETIYNPASFVANTVPLAGRNLTLGARMEF